MAKKKTAQEEEIIDLTELIESGTPATSAAKKAYSAAQSAAAPVEDDFESLLAQTEAADGKKSAQGNRPVDPNEQLDMSDMGDIDNLLESLDIPPQPRESASPAPQEKPAAGDVDDNAGLDGVLDDLLGAGAEEAKSAPAPKPAPVAEEASPNPDLDADLDNILSSFDDDVSAQPKPEKAAPKKAVPTDDSLNLDAELDGILAEMDTPPAKAAPKKPEPAEDNFQLPTDLDGLLDEPAADVEHDTPSPVIPEPQPRLSARNVPNNAISETGMAPVQAISPDLIAGICQNVMAAQAGGVKDSLQDFNRQLGSQSAHLEDLSRNVTDLSKRLFACESKLGAAKARVAALEKSITASSGIDDLIKDGTPMHAGFMSLISAAVGNAVQSVAERLQAAGDLKPAVEALAAHFKKNEASLNSLEERLASLEQNTPHESIDQDARLASLAESERHSLDRIEALENRIAELTNGTGTEDLSPKIDELAASAKATADKLEALAAQVGAMQGADSDAVANMEAKLAALDENNQAVINRVAALENQLSDLPAPVEAPDLSPKIDELAASAKATADKLEALAGQVATMQGSDSDAVASMEAKLAALDENNQAAIKRVAALENQLSALPAPVETPDLSPKIDELAASAKATADTLEALAGQVATMQGSDSDAVASMEAKLAALDANNQAAIKRVAALENQLSDLPAPAEAPDLSPKIDELATSAKATADKLEALAGLVATMQGSDSDAVASMEAKLATLDENNQAAIKRVAALENQLSDLPAPAEAPDLSPKIDELAASAKATADKLEALTAQVATMQDADSDAVASMEAKLATLDENNQVAINRVAALENQLSDLPAPAETPDLSPKIDELAASVTFANERLDALSSQMSNLQAADTGTIGNIETRLAAFAESSDAVLAHISNLEKSVSEIRENAPQGAGDITESLKKLSTGERSARARMDSLEKRLDDLEPNFNVQVEKAAATAVARILHEEIKKLAEG